MTAIRNILTKICTFAAYVAMAVTVLLMLITTVDVILRKVSDYSIMGSYEMTQMGMVFLISMGIAYLQLSKGHVRVDMFVRKFPKRFELFLSGVTSLASAAIIALISFAEFVQATDYLHVNAGTSVIHLPYAPFVYAICLGFGLFALVLLLDAIEDFAKGITYSGTEKEDSIGI